jgi:tetratricopeptide (TPR) repeat protein
MIAVGWAMPRHAVGGVAASPAAAGIKLKPPRPRPLNQLPQGSVGNIFASLFPALIIGLILATVGYDLIANTRQYNSVWRILATSLLTIYGQSGLSYGTLWLFFLTAIIPSLAWTDEQKSPWLTLGGSLLIWLTFTLFHLGALSSLAVYQSASDIDRSALVEAIGGLYFRFAIWITILLGLLAITLVSDWPVEASRTTAQIVIAPLVFAAAIGGAAYSNVFIIQADIAHKLGTSLERQGAWPIVIALYEQAVKLAPQEDQYYLYLGRAYLSAANASNDRAQRETMLGISLSKLQEAQKINPLNPDHTANLARLTRTWSTIATDTKTAASRIDQASRYYETSLKLGPAYPTLWNEAAVFDFLLRKNPSAAITKLEKSLKLDSEFDETYLTLAEISRQAAFNEKDSSAQRATYQKSVEAYRGLIALEAGDGRSARLFTAYVGLGYTYSLMGDTDNAVAAYKDSLAAAPKEQALWEVYRAIAESYLKKQDKSNAFAYANQALAAAPANEKPALQALVNSLAK